VQKQVLITNVKKLLDYIGCSNSNWEPRLSMAPQVLIKPLSNTIFKKLKLIDKLDINGGKIHYYVTNTGDIRFDIKLYDTGELRISNDVGLVPANLVGLCNVDLQDGANTYAYHIPGEILMYLNLSQLKNNLSYRFKKVSFLGFAPSLLSHFGCKMPQYMTGDRSRCV